ncbi:MAG: branched-chain amino acid ABC transporter permease [Crenarchaeota archaeon]|nr:branched-chain amino acid ABC transporter permease [Thermoproteota archaeon]
MELPIPELFKAPETWFWFAIYVVVALSLNLEAGLTGIPNFGRHLAVIIGAIVAATLPGYLGLAILPGEAREQLLELLGAETMPSYASNANPLITDFLSKYYAEHTGTAVAMFAFTLLAAAALGALVGLLAAFPAARLREDYLAITLLAAGEALFIISRNLGFLGGTQGLSVPNVAAWLDAAVAGLAARIGTAPHTLASLILAASAAALVLAYMEALSRTPMVRLLRGVRENETAAEALGRDVARVKLKTLMLGSAIAAVAGALFIMSTLSWIAQTYNRVSWTFWPWAMMILGGMGNNLGVVAGAFILATLRMAITQYKDTIAPYLPFQPQWLDYLVLGAVLILVLMVRPEGILPEKTRYPLPREKLEAKAEEAKKRQLHHSQS